MLPSGIQTSSRGNTSLLLALKGLRPNIRSRIGEMAEQLQIQHHSAVELVDRLESSGLVRRQCGTHDRREVLVTTLMDAQPHHRYVLPGSSIWPFVTAIAISIGFVGSVFNPWYIISGTVLTSFGLLGWFWPRRPIELRDEA